MSTNSLPLTRHSISAARTTLHPPHIHLTPVLTSTTLSALASSPRGSRTAGERPAQPTLRLWFKCENLQRGGSFKIRGAVYALGRLLEGVEEGRIDGWVREKGVVTHSSGNHAQALALAARDHNLAAHIIMPSIATPQKIAAAKAYGARVYLSGSTYPEREALTRQVISATGARLISSCDHPDIILGQGTMGLEMQEQVSALMNSSLSPYGRDTPKGKKGLLDGIITPCGGGGMLSGVALSAEGTGVRVFGAEPSYQGADDGRRGFYAGERIEQVETMTVAEGLRVPVGRGPWEVIHGRGLVRDMYSVGEEEILAATRLVWERMKLVVEPSACVGLAVVLFDEDFRAMVEREAGEDGWDLGIVLSGGNVGGEAVAQMLMSDDSARL
ncbi:hypothetical protein E4U17_003344 [Claviceps sp. LM77 group G4]|nr:hypothetical protein E4U17_003344 [Claviceps sp. LM77 group G4]KAG6067628.1 hypothetical protein E4U33_005238 [Claviceps sp. LM78 group G4]KAG6078656.1 hypothetical protein E4U16_001526 [Claviceps sp. LM84 group G4]